MLDNVGMRLPIFLVFFSLTSCAGTTVTRFSEAKNLLREKVYFDHYKTFYCGEDFNSNLDVTSSRNFKSRKTSRRSKRIEWEHVVPAENFGRSFVEWRVGHQKCMTKGKAFKGRKCAGKASASYRKMEADPYNLVPAIGEVNEARSNFRYSELPGVANYFGTCDFKLQDRRVEPRSLVKGDIARIYAYMEKTYGIKLISDAQKKLFEAWSKLDPTDTWECTRIKRIRSFHPETSGVWADCR
jgi:deoxyribonuclease I